MQKLEKNSKFKRKGPVVLIIMDGVGIGKHDEGDAFFSARTPNLNRLMNASIHTQIKAHGIAVGLPSDEDMGNSEVGHNALGAGRIFEQGAKLVSSAIENKSIFSGTWKELIRKPLEGSALHFIGLLSDGNVHSHIDHLLNLIEQSAREGIKKVRVHILLDGRDVPQTSALIYVEQLEKFLSGFREKGFDYLIASGGGRMITTMDRYQADWTIVKRGWDAHVLGTARPFKSAAEAIETYRKEEPEIIDQYMQSFTIVDANGPVGKINDGDSVLFFNFRGDRAIEITQAFEEINFNKFDRVKKPDVYFAGMMQYDGDLMVPKKYLVVPPAIDNTISEYLAKSGVTQYAISETQKFGHVTYFWNGNRSGKFDEKTEDYFEVPSDKVEFNQRPWMKAAEITDKVIEILDSGKYDFIRMNYPNGDMVGHTGDLDAAIIAAEALDLSIGRLIRHLDNAGAVTIITADHGNLEEMFEIDKKTGLPQIDTATGIKKPKTSHTLNPVPVIFYNNNFHNDYKLSDVKDPGLANIASTILLFLGYNPPEDYMPPLIKFN